MAVALEALRQSGSNQRIKIAEDRGAPEHRVGDPELLVEIGSRDRSPAASQGIENDLALRGQPLSRRRQTLCCVPIAGRGHDANPGVARTGALCEGERERPAVAREAR